ncbi:MAG TPA: NAD(P)/FAD-dependent oxidoreductase [Leptospiraceae bacterium]|nr:NAD(P)/FAD-dependent oxidoreductase [Leptospiraceae bacterium]HMY69627.1 NAD(P)/FAD-dependent oxidoreductase [Leptospiraceae bacterium]HNF27277.1 NAD(P)/FAD-dependent oxidoreductase [Leptospiraceae bacterium]HNM03668.1 NAD(P)/FAD-dependent oxidoreductase [Leptospiraceae bacterium]HNN05156.1 NAD(P)/FAD-dependent oxidoreductase [Leptospiraceae bacterium]
MKKILILGAGISGNTAAMYAKAGGGKDIEVTVVSPGSRWNWIPSNIWVGVGLMKPEQVTFELEPVYRKAGINFKQAKAVSIHPEGSETNPNPFVRIEYTSPSKQGTAEDVEYDFLINATGPRLNFGATEGLGPEKNSHSVCTFGHAESAWKALRVSIEKMKKGETQTLLIGTGHGNCTCQGAAFEYLFNVEHTLREHNVRDKANLVWISNEYELGDFGIGGMHIKRGGYVTHSRIFAESLYAERGISWIKRAHVQNVGAGSVRYETLDGEEKEQKFDFAMLLPPFSGVGLKAYNKKSEDISSILFAPSGFMYVDGDYSAKPYEEWKPEDWPNHYQSPAYKNIFAIGIAFAPPHAISKPMKSPKGTPIFPAPPRTGMPSGVMGREAAKSILDMINGAEKPTRTASLARMGAACIASAGASLFGGSAVSMTMYPIVPDYKKFPLYGRDLDLTTGEIGLAGHWIKYILHYVFMYKAKGNPLWKWIPE